MREKWPKIFIAGYLIINIILPLYAETDKKPDSWDSLIDQYISLDHLSAETCEDYRRGDSTQQEMKNKILLNGSVYFPRLVAKYNKADLKDDIQYEWLFKLMEQICVNNPSLDDYLIDNFPGHYDLIAACRTKEGMYYLEDEYRALSPERNFILELFMDFDDEEMLTSDEDMFNRELILILLAVDGEHPGALDILLNEFEEGRFLITCRLMEQYDKEYIKKPFLTDEYREILLDKLKDDFNSYILGTVLGDNESMQRLRENLLKIDPVQKLQEESDKVNLSFLWLIRRLIEKDVLDEQILDKYIDIAVYNNLETIDVKRMLGRICGSSSEISKKVCRYISTHPPLRTSNQYDLCMYPELGTYLKYIRETTEE